MCKWVEMIEGLHHDAAMFVFLKYRLVSTESLLHLAIPCRAIHETVTRRKYVA
jgi:hypothetical protein